MTKDENEYEIFSPEWKAARDKRLEQERLEEQAKIARYIEEGLTGSLYAAHFNNWEGDPRYPNLSGRVDLDVRGRFHHGEFISTSTLQRIYVRDGRTFAETRYSTYELLDFDPVDIPEDYKFAFQDI